MWAETLTCRYTGEKVTGSFVLADDADIDWDNNECPVCGACGDEECYTEAGDSLGRWVHAARGEPAEEAEAL